MQDIDCRSLSMLSELGFSGFKDEQDTKSACILNILVIFKSQKSNSDNIQKSAFIKSKNLQAQIIW